MAAAEGLLSQGRYAIIRPMEETRRESVRCAGICAHCPRAGDCPTRRAAETSPVLLAGRRPTASVRTESGIGFAVDLGSTTLALALYDLPTGALLAEKGCRNPQTAVSPDVIGRIAAAATPAGLARLRQLVLNALGSLLGEACAAARCTPANLRDGVVTGNTVMLHLFAGRSPEALGHAPFQADWLAGEEAELFGRPVWLPPCIGAFVGADHVCALLAADFTPTGPAALLCDLGTNAEVAVRANGVLYTTSTAAGPAFESTGVRGSDLLDALARFRAEGVITASGESDSSHLVLADGRRLRPADVRAVQLAKAAVAAGTAALLDAAGLAATDLTEIALAGGFGCALNPASAKALGLLPDVPDARLTPLGNAALAGAADLLLFPAHRTDALTLARTAKRVELGGSDAFAKRFLGAMAFEPWR